MQHLWEAFDNGSTIGSVGAESGTVILDIENTQGARITLEQESDHAPYVITLGVYGLLMHTDFYSTLAAAQLAVTSFKIKVETLIDHYDIPEPKRAQNWRAKLNHLMDTFTA